MKRTIPLRERKKIRTRNAIISAAEKLFLRKGYDNTTIDDIANEVEIHKTTVLNYFNTKEELALAHQYVVLEDFERGLFDPERIVSVVGFWRSHVERMADEHARLGDVSRLDSVIRSDTRLFGQALAILARYEHIMCEALCSEAGTEPLTDLRSRLFAALLVSGNRSVFSAANTTGSFDGLREECLRVVDLAAELFDYSSPSDRAKASPPGLRRT